MGPKISSFSHESADLRHEAGLIQLTASHHISKNSPQSCGTFRNVLIFKLQYGRPLLVVCSLRICFQWIYKQVTSSGPSGRQPADVACCRDKNSWYGLHNKKSLNILECFNNPVQNTEDISIQLACFPRIYWYKPI